MTGDVCDGRDFFVKRILCQHGYPSDFQNDAVPASRED
jgi:hypothetical protein